MFNDWHFDWLVVCVQWSATATIHMQLSDRLLTNRGQSEFATSFASSRYVALVELPAVRHSSGCPSCRLNVDAASSSHDARTAAEQAEGLTRNGIACRAVSKGRVELSCTLSGNTIYSADSGSLKYADHHGYHTFLRPTSLCLHCVMALSTMDCPSCLLRSPPAGPAV